MLGFNATVDTTGCDYTFTTPTKTDTTGPHAQMDIVLASGAAECVIKVDAAGDLCSWHIPNQTEAGLVDYMNEGEASTRDITIDSTMTGIDYTGTKGFCTGTGSDGTYQGATTLKGFDGGKQVGIWVTNN